MIALQQSPLRFDWDGDGRREKTGWAGPDDGFLVLDRNGDGQITEANEISFGSYSGRNQPFVTDLEGLREFDSNGNGSLDSGDEAFAQFRVWKDANSNAVADASELIGLDELGFLAMSLTGYETGDKIKKKQNVIYATTDVAMADGSVLKAADVLLAYKEKHAGLQTAAEDLNASLSFGASALWIEAPPYVV